MAGDVDADIGWLAGMLCLATWRDAAGAARDRGMTTAGFDADAELQAHGTMLAGGRSCIVAGFANRVRVVDPVLSCAWEMLALRTEDERTVIHSAVAGAIGVLVSAKGDTREARARLRVWDDVARGKYDGNAYRGDFFDIASRYWGGEMQRIVKMRPATDIEKHPALNILMMGRWDDAASWLHGASTDQTPRCRLDDLMASFAERGACQIVIVDLIEDLYAVGTPAAGALALAWSMLTCDPRKPASFHTVLPQLQHALDQTNLEADDDADVGRRLRTWWEAADGEYRTSKVSIFRLADPEAECWPDPLAPEPEVVQTSTPQSPDLGIPTLVVMPKSKAAKIKSEHVSYKNMVDAALPLVVVRDLQGLRSALHAEFPHAVAAVDHLLRGLHEGKPARMKPVLLVGPPGSSKSRLIRRLGDLLSIGVYRFDGGSSSDGVGYGGTPRGWSESTPAVPTRAVQQFWIANPIVMVDEIEKASLNPRNGALWSVLLGHLERETAARFRDVALDSEIDLSWVSHVATANSTDPLPAPLKDRYRIVRVPAPTLQHLPSLAASVMRDLAAEDEARAGDDPIAGDELDVIGKAWKKAGFSMRSLQKIVAATLEARDSNAMRH